MKAAFGVRQALRLLWVCAALVAGCAGFVALAARTPQEVPYATAGLATGDYSAVITITASVASGSPAQIPVTLRVRPAQTVAGDFDGDHRADPGGPARRGLGPQHVQREPGLGGRHKGDEASLAGELQRIES